MKTDLKNEHKASTHLLSKVLEMLINIELERNDKA